MNNNNTTLIVLIETGAEYSKRSTILHCILNYKQIYYLLIICLLFISRDKNIYTESSQLYSPHTKTFASPPGDCLPFGVGPVC